MENFSAFGSKERHSDKVKLYLRNTYLVITCMCTNRDCGVGDMMMMMRKTEKSRVGERKGIFG